MTLLKSSRPTHLALFVTHPETGSPLDRLPLYAEVAVPRILPARFPETRGNVLETLYPALSRAEPELTEAARQPIVEAVRQTLGDILDLPSRDAIAENPDRGSELFRLMVEVVLSTPKRDRLSDIPIANLKSSIAEALKRAASQLGFTLLPEIQDTGIIWADPLGTVTTDRVGYASFDLTRLHPEVYQMLVAAMEARRKNAAVTPPLAIWVHPYGMTERFDVLAQARFTTDAIVGRLSLKASALPPTLKNMGSTALQNPSLTDWRLSPASFAANPKALIGENGCEELLPSNLALQEFILRQVVRLSVEEPEKRPPQFREVPSQFKYAYVDEYKVSWYSLGHSLGEILYSLPLAPGESVKLAVIDWSWDSLTVRDEKTQLSESILHQTHRDRTITETVKAGLKEMQHGSSFMGGAAGSSGATGGANLGVVGVGAAVGNTWSLGGSTATSDGSRDLAAENVQRLSDSFTQASSAQRELNSTVVIQARQEEKESIQTRTFTNYNHSHTLTILYYEVLRHYRITVEWVRRRNAVLVQIPPHILEKDGQLILTPMPARIDKFDANTSIAHRFLLEPALLDPSLKPAFDILEKQETIRENQIARGIVPNGVPIPQWWDGDIEFGLFEIGIKVGPDAADETPDIVTVNLVLLDDPNGIVAEIPTIPPQPKVSRLPVTAWKKETEENDINVGERLDTRSTNIGWLFAKPPHLIRWSHLVGFEFILRARDGGNQRNANAFRIDRLAINAFHNGGRRVLLGDSPVGDIDVDLYFHVNGSSNTITHINRPSPKPAPLPAIQTPEKSLTADELHQVKKLTTHFELHKDYYNRVILLNTDFTAIAMQFEKDPWLADNVDPTPLEVFGSYIAYPLAKRQQIDDALILDLSAALNSLDPAQRQQAENRLAQFSPDERNYINERLALAAAKSERLITLPTRGVFAEGKLGHCNLSEEIDNTRFWKWDEHPIPFEAPGINPVTPITPQPQQTNIAPTAFPQSLVNIVNPSPAPDPTGLSAALALLGTPNIFRDLSGRQEVADLLKKLSDNTIAIAEAANRAREIQAKYGTDLDKNEKDLALGQTQADADVAKAMLQQRREEAQQVKPNEAQDAIKLSENEMKKGNTSPEEHKAYTKQQLQNVRGASQKSSDEKSLITAIVNFKHQISGPLDGEFTLEFIGSNVAGFYTRTSGGVGSSGNNPLGLYAGEKYLVQIKGKRTQLPFSPNTIARVPSILGSPEFSLDVSKHITNKDIPIETNLVVTIPKGKKTIHLTVVADEITKDVKISVKLNASGTGSLKAELEVALGTKFLDLNVGQFKPEAAVEVSIGGEVGIELPIEYKLLTGNVRAEKNDLEL